MFNNKKEGDEEAIGSLVKHANEELQDETQYNCINLTQFRRLLLFVLLGGLFWLLKNICLLTEKLYKLELKYSQHHKKQRSCPHWTEPLKREMTANLHGYVDRPSY